ncbi:MAG: cobalamin B12-binding domain-containing protein, partial [Candidatus Sumerlaeia bacterium]|nr:cobalamin B12-binding domain-containing protein [Candidatus Sumerlaeia bacterium]
MKILLINPWIYDFSAFDLWAKPLGLLYLASLLRQSGAEVFLVDCLDRYHWSLRHKPVKENEFGCGKYPATEIPKPAPLKFIPRRYKRYGILPDAFITDLKNTGKPDVILVTSRMTYWYPAVVEVIRICRQIFPDSPVILGGTYATLMP